MVKNLQVIENTIFSSTHEGGLSYINYYKYYYVYVVLPLLSKSIAVFQYIQVISKLKLQNNISTPY